MAYRVLKPAYTSHINLKLTIGKSKKVIQSSRHLLPSYNFKLENGTTNYSTATIFEEPSSGRPVIQAKPTSEIPGPMELPILGTTLAFIMRKDFDKRKIHVFFKNMVEEYGPIVKMKFPGQKPAVIISKPEDFETLYRVTMNNPIREGPVSLKKVRDEAINNYFEKKAGLLPENNEEWWRVRSRVQTPMMKPKNIVRYLSQMDEVSLEFMDRIADFQKEFNEMPEYFLSELYKWALESVGLVALNRRLGCLQKNLPSDSMQMKLINTVNDMIASLDNTELGLRLWRWFPTPSYRKLTRAHNTFLEIADANICETEAALKARGKIETEDELTLMESLLLTEGLSRKDVVTLILDMLFAGIDTTSHTIAFTLYNLAKNPEAQKKLQKEVDEVLGDGKSPVTGSQLSKLSYLKACVKESLRILPITLGTMRVLEQDTVLSGYEVPKGYQVFTLVMMSGWDKNNFERVDEFLPERWGRDRPLGTIHPYSSLPFSHGTRMCIGRRIAEQEIYTFLARTFHRYNVEYNYGEMGMKAFIIFKPSHPLRFKFTDRIKN